MDHVDPTPKTKLLQIIDEITVNLFFRMSEPRRGEGETTRYVKREEEES